VFLEILFEQVFHHLVMLEEKHSQIIGAQIVIFLLEFAIRMIKIWL
jgi:hypothetical protein